MTGGPPRYTVLVKRIGTDEVVKSMGPHTEKMAERIERGASVNLDHERFYTVIVASEIADSEDDDE